MLNRLVGLVATAALCVLAAAQSPRTLAQTLPRQRPLATLEAASVVHFPATTDSNSPAFWRRAHGLPLLVLLNSAPHPVLSVGRTLEQRNFIRATTFNNVVNGARWMEAVVPDPSSGVLYGYYHREPAGVCPDDPSKTAPSIGAARSNDGGLSWIDLGPIIEAAPAVPDCESPNTYFAGGVGDFSAILDDNGSDLYILFSTYGPDFSRQGVAVARMLWGDRDEPAGRVGIWSDGVWRYPEPSDEGLIYPAASPILPAQTSWHNRLGQVDAFWGPSVHWNTFLNRYVMLLNRAKDSTWAQEGIYVSATRTLANPASWSLPQKLLDGGRWYPQVMGLELGRGTDRLAGERARLFMAGASEYEIVFQSRDVAVPRVR